VNKVAKFKGTSEDGAKDRLEDLLASGGFVGRVEVAAEAADGGEPDRAELVDEAPWAVAVRRGCSSHVCNVVPASGPECGHATRVVATRVRCTQVGL
jgi:hypothetical protein